MGSSGLVGHFGRTRTNDVLSALRTIFVVVPGRSPRQREVVGDWFEERQRWQRVPEELDRSFAKYEAWVRELLAYNDWLKEQREAWEARARAADSRVRELEAARSESRLSREAHRVRGHLSSVVGRVRARRG
jgi:hypothetical protein